MKNSTLATVFYYNNLKENYGIDIFIRKYFNHIKTKSFLYTKKTSSFNISGEEKKNYFKSQSIENIFEEFLLCCRLHE